MCIVPEPVRIDDLNSRWVIAYAERINFLSSDLIRPWLVKFDLKIEQSYITLNQHTITKRFFPI